MKREDGNCLFHKFLIEKWDDGNFPNFDLSLVLRPPNSQKIAPVL
jgi:hypothetical protein